MGLWFFCCRAVDPGAVKTNIMHELPSYIQVLAFCSLKVFRLMQSSEGAAESVIDAALAPPVRHSVLEFFIRSWCGWWDLFWWTLCRKCQAHISLEETGGPSNPQRFLVIQNLLRNYGTLHVSYLMSCSKLTLERWHSHRIQTVETFWFVQESFRDI